LLPAGAVAGWGSHPLESAALSRRTRQADVACRAVYVATGRRRTFLCVRVTNGAFGHPSLLRRRVFAGELYNALDLGK
jgi:hypothetical protein